MKIQKGFSLLEVLIALCLVSTLILVSDFAFSKMLAHHARLNHLNQAAFNVMTLSLADGGGSAPSIINENAP